MDQKKTIRPFSMKDKIGYTLGDLGCCLTEQYRAMYLSIFYTLILQVNPFHVGILLLITKIWDAVNDPIIGALVDSRKATKGGKFIPWIRAFSFPMAVLCILGFVNVGNINYGLRLAYMFVTYVLYEALYTCVNVPFGTLSSVMTDDVSQRTALSRYRSLGGTIFMTVMVMVGPLFLYVDNQPVAGRFLMLACICAMLGLLCLQITCVWCKERVEVPERPQGEKLNYLHVLKEISHNKALLGVMFFSLTGMIGASVVNGLNTYLYKDFFGNVKIQAVSGMLSVLYAVLSFAITQPLANKFGKKEWCCMGAGFAAIVFGILFFFPVHNPVAFIVINGICYLGASGMQVLIWAMVNDAIDYHELQTGERNEGIVYSTYSFFRKLASAISGSLSSFVLGAMLTMLMLGMAAISLVWTPWSPYEVDLAAKLQPPSTAHWLGTDAFGRDILSLLMVGARNSILVGVIAVGIGMGVGTALGLLAAARKGWVEEAIMRLADFTFAFPALLLAIMLTAVFGAGIVNSIIAIGIFYIPTFARVTRASANAVWAREYILAARACGKGPWRITLEHVLPNILSVLIVQATIQFALAILAEAALSYLGLGTQPPEPSWGRMLSEAQTLMFQAPLLAVWPGVAIALAVLGLNLLGDGLRDLLDPRLARKR